MATDGDTPGGMGGEYPEKTFTPKPGMGGDFPAGGEALGEEGGGDFTEDELHEEGGMGGEFPGEGRSGRVPPSGDRSIGKTGVLHQPEGQEPNVPEPMRQHMGAPD